MKQHHIILLIIAILLTAGVWYHEYLYDFPRHPMTVLDHVIEIAVFGTAYCALFYFIMLGIYTLLAKLLRRL